MQIQTTKNSKVNPVVLVYGPSKIGKTNLARTCDSPIIADVDMGLSSLRDTDIPFLTIRKPDDMKDFLNQAKGNFGYAQGEGFKTIFVDDLTELGMMWLRLNKASFKNPMKAYGELGDWALNLIYELRALSEYGYNVVFLCKEEKVQDANTGGLVWSPSFPGKAIQNMLDYLVGEVYHMEQFVDPNDETQTKHRVFRTLRNPQIAAGSRYGGFGELEFADLGSMFTRMKEVV